MPAPNLQTAAGEGGDDSGSHPLAGLGVIGADSDPPVPEAGLGVTGADQRPPESIEEHIPLKPSSSLQEEEVCKNKNRYVFIRT